MNRNELKQLWFNMDYSNVKERKEIIVETDFGHVEIMSEGPNGYNSFNLKESKSRGCWDNTKNIINTQKLLFFPFTIH